MNPHINDNVFSFVENNESNIDKIQKDIKVEDVDKNDDEDDIDDDEFKCKECSSDECDGLQLTSNYLGLCYQYLNDVENLIGINQVMFTDIYKGHPNGMLIKILDELDQENKLKVQNNPKLLINFIDKKLFLEQEKIIKSFLKIAENEFHRVPKVVQPVLISIKNEVRGRLENMMSKIL